MRLALAPGSERVVVRDIGHPPKFVDVQYLVSRFVAAASADQARGGLCRALPFDMMALSR